MILLITKCNKRSNEPTKYTIDFTIFLIDNIHFETCMKFVVNDENDNYNKIYTSI